MAKPYISDITQFLTDLKKSNPNLEASQLAGRAKLWDKAVKLEDLKVLESNTVPSRSYVYQSKNDWAS